MAQHQIIQFTDLHLFNDPATRLRGVPTFACWQEALAHIHEAGFDPDLLLLTGDLAHDEQLSTYLLLRQMLEHWLQRLLVIPGNHDNRRFIREVFPHQFERYCGPEPLVTFAHEVGQWLLVGLDSQVPGEVNGRIEGAQLDWLDGLLEAHPERRCLLFMHHPPKSIESPWLDELGMWDPEPLTRWIQRKPQIAGIFAGHVHQEYRGSLAGRPLLTTPSTAMQFKPRQAEPAYDPIPCGYRVIELDGSQWSTRVVRLPELRYPPSRDGADDTSG